MRQCYLMMVTADNHNKYYRMAERPGGIFRAEYGRVGQRPQIRSYPMGHWNEKYQEKIAKGYTDVTAIHTDAGKSASDGFAGIREAEVAKLVEQLLSFSRKEISSNYRVSWNEVTPEMIERARRILAELSRTEDTCRFNTQLLALFTVIPRKMEQVSDYMACSDDHAHVLERETELLDNMASQVKLQSLGSADKGDEKGERTILDAAGLSIRACNGQELEDIRKYLTAESAYKMRRAFRVRNHASDRAFADYCSRYDIGKGDRHLLFHGSRNENWWSILSSGLKLYPDAVINGKMFGNGLYFAPRAQKSIRYCSLQGRNYTNENSSTGFLALYEVAYKNPLDVYSHSGEYGRYRDGSLGAGRDALYAHKGSMLVNDEIIVYKEQQTAVRYIIELGC